MSELALNAVLDEVERRKNINRDVLIGALEQAILTAAKKTFGPTREMEAQFNKETGGVDLFLIVNVVEEDPEEGREITREQAQSHGLEAELGDELLFQIFYRPEEAERAGEQDSKFGGIIHLQKAHKKFGRIAAQTAKQVIYQRVREAERDNVYEEYKDRKGELITGTVRRFERGNVVVDLGSAEALLPVRDQVPRESYRAGDTIRAYVKDIDRNSRGPMVILSRTHKGLLEKLFEQEVPEIYEKIVRIESSAREPGARAKIAVASRDRDVDPVGACVGMKGSRVQAVVQELRGEKIDIVPYDDDPARFVCNAIAPAEVSRVIIDAAGHRMELIVPDERLSLAIGRKGQNVRLASQLTGWRIDIHSESKIRELESRAREQIAGVDGITDELAEGLFRLGWRSVADLARAKPEELAGVEGVDTLESGAAIVVSAQTFLEEEQARMQEAKEEAARRASLTAREKLLELEGMDDAFIDALAGFGIVRIEHLAAIEDVHATGSQVGKDPLDIAVLQHLAKRWLFQISEDEPMPTLASISPNTTEPVAAEDSNGVSAEQADGIGQVGDEPVAAEVIQSIESNGVVEEPSA